MSTQQMKVTLSATDSMTPTFKQVIATIDQLKNDLISLDSGFTAVEGKVRTAGAAIRDAIGTQGLGIKAPLTEFNAGLNQMGVNLDSTAQKAVGASSKFASFGNALMQNGTAFGVAGASAFGLFNAIDNLEKVQLRAETATLRSSTATTALSTAEIALANAKASGTASTEQIALLEQRVADARERVSVTTERAAIFQQDYTEAIAGLALQVGPQAIALAGSLAQVYTVLNATFTKGGGAITILRTAFASLTGSQATANVLASSGIPIFNGMGASAQVASVGVRGLSTALKGLLISTGIGAIIAIGGAIAEMALTMKDASATTAEFADSNAASLGEAGGSAKDFETSWQTSMKTVDSTTVATGDHIAQIMQKIADDTKTSLDKVKQMTLQNTVDMKKALLAAAQQQLAGIPQTQSLLGALVSGQTDLPKEAKDKLNATITQLQTDLKSLEPQLQKTTDQFTAMWLGSNTGANLLLGSLSLVDKEMLKIPGSAGVVIADMQNLAIAAKDTATNIAGPFVAAWKAGTIPMEVAKTAVTNIIKEFASLSKIPMDLLLANVNELFKEGANSGTTYAQALAKATAEMQLSNEEAAKMAVAHATAITHNQLMTASLAGEATALATTTGQQAAFNTVIVAGIDGLNNQAIALLTKRDANLVANAATLAGITAAGDEVIALTNLGAIYDGSATSLLALTAAKVAGVTAAADFVTQTALEATQLEATTAALETYITTVEGVKIPEWLTVTPELLKAMQKEIDATGADAALLADQWTKTLAGSQDVWNKIISNTKIKDLKKEFKDVEFGQISDKLENLFLKGAKAAEIFAEKGREADNTVDFLLNTMLNTDVSQGQFNKGIDNIVKKFDGLSKKLGPESTQVIADYAKSLKEMTPEEALQGMIKLSQLSEEVKNGLEAGKAPAEILNGILAKYGELVPGLGGVSSAVDGISASLKAATDSLKDVDKLSDTAKVMLGLKAPEGITTVEGGKFVNKPVTPVTPEPPKKEEGTVVPAPTKAAGFDEAKKAIVNEVKTMFTVEPIPPAIIPAPDATAFANAMNTLLLIPADFTTRFNAAFVGLVIPAPTSDAFAAGLKGVIDQAALASQLIIASFSALMIPAPKTDIFIAGMGLAAKAIDGVASAIITISSTTFTIPAPNTSAFTDAFASLSTDVVESLDEIRTFTADDLTTSFTNLDTFVSGDVTDMFSQFATDTNDSLQEIVDFLEDDMVKGFDIMGKAGIKAGNDVGAAMEDIQTAADGAKSAVDDLTSSLNAIPTDIQVTITITTVEKGGTKAGATGYHGIVDQPTVFLAGESGKEKVDIHPLEGPDLAGFTDNSSPNASSTSYNAPPAVSGNVGPIIANITIPVYVNGRYEGTQQTQRIIRDIGAFL